MTPGWSPETMLTSLERAQEARIAELERRLAEMERLYDKAAADLIEALDVASAYRATASTMHQEIERRNGVERRQGDWRSSLVNVPLTFSAFLPAAEPHQEVERRNGVERRQSITGDPSLGRRVGIYREDRRKSWPR